MQTLYLKAWCKEADKTCYAANCDPNSILCVLTPCKAKYV